MSRRGDHARTSAADADDVAVTEPAGPLPRPGDLAGQGRPGPPPPGRGARPGSRAQHAAGRKSVADLAVEPQNGPPRPADPGAGKIAGFPNRPSNLCASLHAESVSGPVTLSAKGAAPPARGGTSPRHLTGAPASYDIDVHQCRRDSCASRATRPDPQAPQSRLDRTVQCDHCGPRRVQERKMLENP